MTAATTILIKVTQVLHREPLLLVHELNTKYTKATTLIDGKPLMWFSPWNGLPSFWQPSLSVLELLKFIAVYQGLSRLSLRLKARSPVTVVISMSKWIKMAAVWKYHHWLSCKKNACTLSSDIIILSFGDVLLHISPTHQMHREFSLACLRSRPLSSHLINP